MDKMKTENKCTCGDLENEHIDNEAQCFIIGCGCKEFESAEDETMKKEEMEIDKI